MVRESRWRSYLLEVMVFHSYVRLVKGTYFCCMILPVMLYNVYWYRYVRSTSAPGSVHVCATLHACAACIWICIYIYTFLILSFSLYVQQIKYCNKLIVILFHPMNMTYMHTNSFWNTYMHLSVNLQRHICTCSPTDVHTGFLDRMSLQATNNV